MCLQVWLRPRRRGRSPRPRLVERREQGILGVGPFVGVPASLRHHAGHGSPGHGTARLHQHLEIESVGEALGREFLDVVVDVDPSDGRLLAYLSAKGEVLSREVSESMITVHVRMPSGMMGPVTKSAMSVRPAEDPPLPIDDTNVELPSAMPIDPPSEVA